MTPTRDDYSDWLQSPVTRWVFAEIAKLKEKLKDDVTYGSSVYNPEDAVKTTVLMGQTIGFVRGLDEIQKIQPIGKQK